LLPLMRFPSIAPKPVARRRRPQLREDLINLSPTVVGFSSAT
jgi:hypothetical protein